MSAPRTEEVDVCFTWEANLAKYLTTGYLVVNNMKTAE